MCAGCPVAAACLQEAVSRRDSGFRGGVLLIDGRAAAAAAAAATLKPCGTYAAWRRHPAPRRTPLRRLCRCTCTLRGRAQQ